MMRQPQPDCRSTKRSSASTPIHVAALAVTIMMLLTACGSSNDVSSSSTEPAKSEVADTASSESPTEPEAEPDVEGEAEAEGQPDADGDGAGDNDRVRVVDLSDFQFDLAALGNPPLANIYGPEFLGPVLATSILPPDEQEALLAGENVAPAFELNVEAVLALDPDLIITSTFLVTFFPSIAQLEENIPVLVIDDELDWRDRSRATADAIDKAGAFDERIELAEESINALSTRVEELGLTGTEVSLLRAFNGEVTSFNPPSLASSIVAEIGLTQPAAQLAQPGGDGSQPGYAAQTVLSNEVLVDQEAPYAIIANTFDLSSPIAELPTDGSQALVPVLNDPARVLVTSYFFWALNSVIGVEQIVFDLNRLLDKIENNG